MANRRPLFGESMLQSVVEVARNLRPDMISNGRTVSRLDDDDDGDDFDESCSNVQT